MIASGICTCEDRRYSDKSTFSDSRICIDRITDRIEAQVPDTCLELLAYRTGACQVVDWLGDSIAKGKLPQGSTAVRLPIWKQIDQARYEAAKGYIIATGIQPDDKPYNRFRHLVNWVGAEILARHDDEALSAVKGPLDEGYGGIFSDNWNVNPVQSFAGPGAFWPVEALDAMDTYVEQLGHTWRTYINCRLPHVYKYREGNTAPMLAGGKRNVDHWCKLGIYGLYYEADAVTDNPSEEQRAVMTTLEYARDCGLVVIVGRTVSKYPAWENFWAQLSANGADRSVYRSRD